MSDGSAAAVEVARRLLSGPPKLGSTRLAAVDGPSGSGKTVFAARLAVATAGLGDGHVLDLSAPDPGGAGPAVAILSTDLLATWADPFGWWDRLEAAVLRPLAAGRAGALLINEWSSGQPRPGAVLAVPPVEVLILEGVSTARWAVASRLTTAVWVQIDNRDRRLARAVARDGEASRRHLEIWQEAEDRHFDQDGTRLRADVVVRPGG